METVGRISFQTIVVEDVLFQQELDESASREQLLVVELFTKWAGPCVAVKPSFQRIALGNPKEIPLHFVLVDIDAILEGVSAKSVSVSSSSNAVTDCSPEKWVAVLRDFRDTIRPVFLFYKSGKLLEIIEGANLPLLLRCIDAFTCKASNSLSFEGEQQPQILCKFDERKRRNAIFAIQCKWRRLKQFRRLGVFISGKFYTHKEIARLREEDRRKKTEISWREKQNASATKIQAVFRGHWTRSSIEARNKMNAARRNKKKGFRSPPRRQDEKNVTTINTTPLLVKKKATKIEIASVSSSHKKEPNAAEKSPKASSMKTAPIAHRQQKESTLSVTPQVSTSENPKLNTELLLDSPPQHNENDSQESGIVVVREEEYHDDVVVADLPISKQLITSGSDLKDEEELCQTSQLPTGNDNHIINMSPIVGILSSVDNKVHNDVDDTQNPSHDAGVDVTNAIPNGMHGEKQQLQKEKNEEDLEVEKISNELQFKAEE